MDCCEVDFFDEVVANKVCTNLEARVVLLPIWDGVSIESFHANLQ